MAPEIVKMFGKGDYAAEGYTDAVDWWSLGVSVYRLLVGSQPFNRISYDELQFIFPGVVKRFENYQDAFTSVFGSVNYYPADVSLGAETIDFISQLLSFNPEHRLGNNPDNEMTIKKHAFFKDINWDLLDKKMVPPPYVPVNDILDSMLAETLEERLLGGVGSGGMVDGNSGISTASNNNNNNNVNAPAPTALGLPPLVIPPSSAIAVNTTRSDVLTKHSTFRDMLRYYNKSVWMPDENAPPSNNPSPHVVPNHGNTGGTGNPPVNTNASAASSANTPGSKFQAYANMNRQMYSKYRISDDLQHYFHDWHYVSPSIIDEERFYADSRKSKASTYRTILPWGLTNAS